MIDRIHWLGHGSFVIDGGDASETENCAPLIYINPWRVTHAEHPADIILVSHDHYDHCSVADIDKLRDNHTQVIANERAAALIPNCTVLRPWQTVCIDRVSVKAVPAYSPTDSRHAESSGGIGFIISLNFYDIYYAGDTQLIPEMSRIHPDIAILPIDDSGTMNPEEAAQAAEIMGARWVIPSNWGTGIGGATRVDAQILARELEGKAAVPILLPHLK
jgi:L-ascorbate metabolism protein UlaG (beta-lactamase superfamily)